MSTLANLTSAAYNTDAQDSTDDSPAPVAIAQAPPSAPALPQAAPPAPSASTQPATLPGQTTPQPVPNMTPQPAVAQSGGAPVYQDLQPGELQLDARFPKRGVAKPSTARSASATEETTPETEESPVVPTDQELLDALNPVDKDKQNIQSAATADAQGRVSGAHDVAGDANNLSPKDNPTPKEIKDHHTAKDKALVIKDQEQKTTKAIPSKDFKTQMADNVRGVGSFANEVIKGIGMGEIHNLNQAMALGVQLGGGKDLPGQQDLEKSSEDEYVTPEEKASLPYKIAKGASSGVNYALASAPMGATLEAGIQALAPTSEALAAMTPTAAKASQKAMESLGNIVRTGSAAAEGGILSAAGSAAEQMKETGKVDPAKMIADAAIGAGFGAGGQKALNTIGLAAKNLKIIKDNAEAAKKAADPLAQSIAKAEQALQDALIHDTKEAAENAINSELKLLKRIAQDAIAMAHHMEQEAAKKVAQVFGPQPATTPLAMAQKEIVDAIDDAYKVLAQPNNPQDVIKGAISVLKAAGVAHVDEIEKLVEGDAAAGLDNSAGIFRRTLVSQEHRGFGAVENATPFESAQTYLSDVLYRRGKKALNEIHKAKALMMDLENNVQHYIENAFSLAKTDAQKAMVPQLPPRMNSEGTAELNKATAELREAQRQANIKMTEAKLAKAEGVLKTSAKGKNLDLPRQIQEMHAHLQHLRNPQFELTAEQNAYTIGDKAHFAAASAHARGSEGPWKGVADTFEEAVNQARHEEQLLKSATQHMHDVQEEHEPLLHELQTAWQTHHNNKIDSPAWMTKAAHPYNGKVTAPIATQLRFKAGKEDPVFTKLLGKFAQRRAEIEEAIMADPKYVANQILHKIVGTLPSISKAKAQKMLTDAKHMNPTTRRLLSVLAMTGASMMGVHEAAEAAELDKLPEEQQGDYWLDTLKVPFAIGASLTAAFLITKFGHAGAKHVLRVPAAYLKILTYWTSDGLRLADKLRGITPTLHPLEGGVTGFDKEIIPHEQRSLAQAFSELQGLYGKASTLVPGYGEYFTRQLTGEIQLVSDWRVPSPGKPLPPVTTAFEKLSEPLKRLMGTAKEAQIPNEAAITMAAEVRHAEKELGEIATAYEKELDKFAATAPAHMHDDIKLAQECVRFIRAGYSNIPSRSVAETVFAKAYRGMCRAMFVGKFSNQVAAATGDRLGTAMLQHGPNLTAHAEKDLGLQLFGKVLKMNDGAANPILLNAVNRIKVAGPRAQSLGEETNPFAVENMQKNLCAATTMLKYYHDYTPKMNELNLRNYHEFADQLTQGKLPLDITDHAFEKIMQDLNAIGFDPSGLEKNFLERTEKFKTLFAFTRQPVTEGKLYLQNAKLMVANLTEGDYQGMVRRLGWITAHHAVKWQAAGAKAAIPAGLIWAGMNNPYTSTFCAKVVSTLNDYSLGVNTIGDNSDILAGDALLSPLTGITNSPGIADYADFVMDASGFLTKMGKVGLMAGVDFAHLDKTRDEFLADPLEKTKSVGEGVERVTLGTRFNKDTAEAHAATHHFINALSMFEPIIMKVPTQLFGSALEYMPDIVNAESFQTIKHPGLSSSHFSLEPAKARKAVPIQKFNPEAIDPDTGEKGMWEDNEPNPFGLPLDQQGLADLRARFGGLKMALRMGMPSDRAKLLLWRQAAKEGADPGVVDMLRRQAGWSQ